MKNVCWTVACVFIVPTVVAAPLEWTFPRLGSCHEGLAFSDGVTGVLVWGGGDTVNLTVGRADLWDHRGGYPWTAAQSYTNIVAAVQAGDKDRLYGLFKKETPTGEPRNPYLLPLGRVVLKTPGWEVRRGTLDPFTGLGTLDFERADGSDRVTAELAMAKAVRAFAMKVDPRLKPQVSVRHCLEFPEAKKQLEPVGVKSAKMRADGFDWELPADASVSLDVVSRDGELLLSTRRSGCSSANCTAPAHFAEKRPRFEAVRQESVAHWQAFWREGARVRVPDAKIQEIFDYGMYRFGAMTDPDGVPAGLQGSWLEDDRRVPWNGDYHFNINVQECYSPAYRGGHFAHLLPLFRMVLSWRPLLKDNARKFAGVDGYVLPHSVDDRGVCIGGFWTGTIDHACTAWIASMMYRYVRYSGDVAFLKDGAFDFMKGAMNVYLAMTEEKDGRLSLPLGPSPEWGAADVRKAVGRDPSFQLAAAHRLARDLIDAAARLGEKPDARWLDVEKRLPRATVGKEGIILFEGQPLVESHRHHSHLAGFYPFDILDLGAMRKDGSLVATFDTWVGKGTGMWSGWCVPWASILQTHFGQATAAAQHLRDWEVYFCNPGHGSLHNAYASGYTLLATDSAWTQGRQIMQMDGQCAATTAVLELMVHEVNGKVEFFRGCPEDWQDVSFENIALSDGRRVSGRRLNGKVTLTYGRPATAALPAGNAANPNACELSPIPLPVEFKSDMNRPLAFGAATTVTVACPDAAGATWLADHLAAWYGKDAPKVVSGEAAGTPALKDGPEAYAIVADASGVRIAARTLAGVRWAAYTIRQVVIAKRGTMKTAGHLLPTLTVSDAPHLGFRGIHLCWLPEMRPQQIERAIRLAAMFKFNYIVLEPWAVFKSEKHPWISWPDAKMTKAEIRRLVAVGKDLGVTLVPQFASLGHASGSRAGSLKHPVLDLAPEYEPLYEPGGWNWCITNPEAQRVIRDVILELLDAFDRPPYIHLGCDEAQPPTCPDCRRRPYGELCCEHIANLAAFTKEHGARAMIWGDMLLKAGDPRWKGYIATGTDETVRMVDLLPKDVIVCDWQYVNHREAKDKDWPTVRHFAEKGFPVVGCPWDNYKSMRPMADTIAKVGGFGFLETTWHRLHGQDWIAMYLFASAAAWGSDLAPDLPQFDSRFAIPLQLVGRDMKLRDYRDSGHVNYQLPPSWWQN